MPRRTPVRELLEEETAAEASLRRSTRIAQNSPIPTSKITQRRSSANDEPPGKITRAKRLSLSQETDDIKEINTVGTPKKTRSTRSVSKSPTSQKDSETKSIPTRTRARRGSLSATAEEEEGEPSSSARVTTRRRSLRSESKSPVTVKDVEPAKPRSRRGSTSERTASLEVIEESPVKKKTTRVTRRSSVNEMSQLDVIEEDETDKTESKRAKMEIITEITEVDENKTPIKKINSDNLDKNTTRASISPVVVLENVDSVVKKQGILGNTDKEEIDENDKKTPTTKINSDNLDDDTVRKCLSPVVLEKAESFENTNEEEKIDKNNKETPGKKINSVQKTIVESLSPVVLLEKIESVVKPGDTVKTQEVLENTEETKVDESIDRTDNKTSANKLPVLKSAVVNVQQRRDISNLINARSEETETPKREKNIESGDSKTSTSKTLDNASLLEKNEKPISSQIDSNIEQEPNKTNENVQSKSINEESKDEDPHKVDSNKQEPNEDNTEANINVPPDSVNTKINEESKNKDLDVIQSNIEQEPKTNKYVPSEFANDKTNEEDKKKDVEKSTENILLVNSEKASTERDLLKKSLNEIVRENEEAASTTTTTLMQSNDGERASVNQSTEIVNETTLDHNGGNEEHFEIDVITVNEKSSHVVTEEVSAEKNLSNTNQSKEDSTLDVNVSLQNESEETEKISDISAETSIVEDKNLAEINNKSLTNLLSNQLDMSLGSDGSFQMNLSTLAQGNSKEDIATDSDPTKEKGISEQLNKSGGSDKENGETLNKISESTPQSKPLTENRTPLSSISLKDSEKSPNILNKSLNDTSFYEPMEVDTSVVMHLEEVTKSNRSSLNSKEEFSKNLDASLNRASTDLVKKNSNDISQHGKNLIENEKIVHSYSANTIIKDIKNDSIVTRIEEIVNEDSIERNLEEMEKNESTENKLGVMENNDSKQDKTEDNIEELPRNVSSEDKTETVQANDNEILMKKTPISSNESSTPDAISNTSSPILKKSNDVTQSTEETEKENLTSQSLNDSNIEDVENLDITRDISKDNQSSKISEEHSNEATSLIFNISETDSEEDEEKTSDGDKNKKTENIENSIQNEEEPSDAINEENNISEYEVSEGNKISTSSVNIKTVEPVSEITTSSKDISNDIENSADTEDVDDELDEIKNDDIRNKDDSLKYKKIKRIPLERAAALKEEISTIITSDSEEKEDESEDELSANDFIDDLAEEGEEETPSEDSNEIICEGESINSSDTYSEDEEECHDEENLSFIDDDDEGNRELLSGEETFLQDEKIETKESPKKKKHRRIVTQPCDSSGDEEETEDIITENIEKDEVKTKKRRRIVTRPSNSSEEEPDLVEIETDSASKIEKEENTTVKNKTVTDDLKAVETIPENSSDLMPSKNDIICVDSDSDSETDSSTSDSQEDLKEENNSQASLTVNTSKRKSITIQENIKLDEIQDGDLSDRISKVVDWFYSGLRNNVDSSGNISLNVSLDYADQPSVENLNKETEISGKTKTRKSDKRLSDVIVIEDSPKKRTYEDNNDDNVFITPDKPEKKRKSLSEAKVFDELETIPVNVETISPSTSNKKRKIKKKKSLEHLPVDVEGVNEISDSKKIKKLKRKSNEILIDDSPKKMKYNERKYLEIDGTINRNEQINKKKRKQEKMESTDVFSEIEKFKLQENRDEKLSKKKKKIKQIDDINIPDIYNESPNKRRNINKPQTDFTIHTTKAETTSKLKKLKSKKITSSSGEFEQCFIPKVSVSKYEVPVKNKKQKKSKNKVSQKILLNRNVVVDEAWNSNYCDITLLPSTHNKKKSIPNQDKTAIRIVTNPKDFKNQMLYNSKRVTRMDSKMLLKQKQRN